MLLNEPDTTKMRLGENRVVATWGSEDPLLAVVGEKPSRISVVRASDLSTIWSAEAEPKNAQFQTLRVDENKVDVMAPLESENDSIRITRFNGRTGEPIWSRPAQLGGHPIHTQYVRNQDAGARVLIVDNGSKAKRDGCNLSLLNAKSGKLIWERPFMEGSSLLPKSLSNFAIVDANGDGISDICGPDQHSSTAKPVFGMTMWDGRNGKRLWTRRWNYEGSVSSFRPMPWCLVKVGDLQCIAFVEPSVLDGSIHSEFTSIVVCDAIDGHVLSTFKTECRMTPWVRFHSSRIADMTSDPNHPRIVTWLPDEDRVPHLLAFDLASDSISLHKRYETECEKRSVCWLMDVSGDGIPEAVATAGDDLLCYSPSGALLWRTGLVERRGRNRYFSWEDVEGAARYGAIWMGGDTQATGQPVQSSRDTQFIDLRFGTVLSGFKRVETLAAGDSKIRDLAPVVVGVDRGDSQDSDTVCITPTEEGIFVAGTNQGHSPIAKGDVEDPRRVRRLPLALLMPEGGSFIGLLEQQLKRLFITFALVALPLAYIYRIVRYSRWSLRSFLLAPAVLMFFLVAWRSVVATNTTIDLVVVLLNGSVLLVAIYGIVATMHSSRYGVLYVATMTSLFVFLLLYLMNHDRSSSIRFVMGVPDLVLLTAVMLMAAGSVLGVFHAVCRPVYRRAHRIFANKSTAPVAA